MHVLVVGGGGREHALAWRISRAGHRVTAAPGNPGIGRLGELVPIAPTDVSALCEEAVRRQVDLVVVGPEAPLVAGLADELRGQGVPVFGPGASGARLEGSKSFAKSFFHRHGIRTAPFFLCESAAEAERATRELGGRVVVKADGLASGKGVVLCDRAEDAASAARDMLEAGRFGAAGRSVVVEQKLNGRELSIMAITDGQRYELLAQAEDHKAVFDGDQGPNTGGMGAVSPAQHATEELVQKVRREIFDPTMRGLAKDGIDYRGVLYAGLMIDESGEPWMLEYNCRFGDPEAQVVLARLATDPVPALLGAAQGALPAEPAAWDERACTCVVLAAAGYPGSPELGDPLRGIDAAEGLTEPEGAGEVIVFHAGTREHEGELVTSGGRVLGVTALAGDVAASRALAYRAVSSITFRGAHFRGDIGARRAGGTST